MSLTSNSHPSPSRSESSSPHSQFWSLSQPPRTSITPLPRPSTSLSFSNWTSPPRSRSSSAQNDSKVLKFPKQQERPLSNLATSTVHKTMTWPSTPSARQELGHMSKELHKLSRVIWYMKQPTPPSDSSSSTVRTTSSRYWERYLWAVFWHCFHLPTTLRVNRPWQQVSAQVKSARRGYCSVQCTNSSAIRA